jgi:Na+-driven multidrug efflux pump
MASNVIKFLSITVFLDGAQTCGNGIIRSIGAQKYAVLFAIIGFYLIGAPVGIYLLMKTNLTVLGIIFTNFKFHLFLDVFL